MHSLAPLSALRLRVHRKGPSKLGLVVQVGICLSVILGALTMGVATLNPVLAGTERGTGSATKAATTGFVERSGTKLTLNGELYRFTGINIYTAAGAGPPPGCGSEDPLHIEVPLSQMRSGVVVRFWSFQDFEDPLNIEVPLSQMPSGVVVRFWVFQDFFVSKGALDWTNFDQVLTIAAAHGDKVIPVLANSGDYCDGPVKDLAWYQSGYRTTVGPGDIVTYRQYVADVASRYADNPTIAMWQLVNEGNAVNADGTCNESAALSAELGFSNDVGSLAHSLDPSHLVSTGFIAGWQGHGAGQWCGSANGDYQKLMASPGNDVCDYHDYGYQSSPMGIPFPPDLTTAIQMCHADGKPIMVAENGIYATGTSELAPRAADFRAKFVAQFQAGVVGDLMWCWAIGPDYTVPATDADYGIFPGDPSLRVLGTF